VKSLRGKITYALTCMSLTAAIVNSALVIHIVGGRNA
jgi:hypothetical protein